MLRGRRFSVKANQVDPNLRLAYLRPQFAGSDAEAQRRFGRTRRNDPLPDVAPALLNTSDLIEYVAATGMIYPFHSGPPADKWLKPASCAIAFSGQVVHWEHDPKTGDSKKVVEEVKRGEKLILPQNSIVFLTLEPFFRLPDYIAGRYNLAITEIYKGLLVGTGPLVDPGFSGRLSIPVHNLTGSEYELKAGEPIVWMEFTKLSPHDRWGPSERKSAAPFVAFPERKQQRRSINDYLRAASARPVISSIPKEVGFARQAAQDAAKRAETAKGSADRMVRSIRSWSIGAAIVGSIALGALIIQVVQFGIDVNDAVNKDVRGREAIVEELTDMRRVDRRHREEIKSLQRRLSQAP